MSASPLITDIVSEIEHVRFVPGADVRVRDAAVNRSRANRCVGRLWSTSGSGLTNSTIRKGVCLSLWLPGLRREAKSQVKKRAERRWQFAVPT